MALVNIGIVMSDLWMVDKWIKQAFLPCNKLHFLYKNCVCKDIFLHCIEV